MEPKQSARPGMHTSRILGDDEYFVLGDNRNDSIDSRFAEVGAVRRQEIIGKAFVRIYPFSSFGSIGKKRQSGE